MAANGGNFRHIAAKESPDEASARRIILQTEDRFFPRRRAALGTQPGGPSGAGAAGWGAAPE